MRSDIPDEVIERFWSFTKKTGRGCWLWLGATTKIGNPIVNFYKFGNQHPRQITILLHNPDIQSVGRTQVPTCGNKLCVHPAHQVAIVRGKFTKTCGKCHARKSISEFFRRKNKDGRETTCKECRLTTQKIKYQTNDVYRTKQIAQAKVRSKQHRLMLQTYTLTYLKAHGCIDCGEKDPIVLDFDHIRDKIQGISVMVRRHASLEAIKNEIEKCEVRCANCHRRKTARQLNWYADIDLSSL